MNRRVTLTTNQRAELQREYDNLLAKVEGWQIVSVSRDHFAARDMSEKLKRDGLYSVQGR